MKEKIPRFLDPDDPLEKEIEKKVCDYAKREYDIDHRKYANPARRAAPDQILFAPRGKVQRETFFIEFKSKGKPPTTAQLLEHEFYRSMGYTVFVIDSVEYGKQCMDLMA